MSAFIASLAGALIGVALASRDLRRIALLLLVAVCLLEFGMFMTQT